MLVRSMFIALGLISVTWATALYAATQNNKPKAVVASMEIGEIIVLREGAVNAN